MRTAENTSTVREALLASCSPTPLVEAKFHRILVRREGETKHTTVSVSPRIYDDMLKFAYGRAEGVNRVLRRAAVQVKEAAPRQFSRLVRLKALAMLRGAYRPEVANASERLAEANNAVWSASG